ncbi:hypothetical protein HCB58_03210 [Streptococcus suis]|nr:hypothetical protein [Streptococcus suis]MCK3929636.1 hypothetical protein [Streptococcus suis]HEM4366691.1 hypothetical protein [Streptococcus suis]HEM4582302.1 hypothetical protein [Streptococcus suis]HEM6187873.1 hypothetical protein [Streptococcus suis]
MIQRYRAFYEGKMYGVKAAIWTSRGLYVTLDEGNKAGRRVRGAKLMQSTGLFDVNGKEIFEGDVVESTWFKGYDDCVGYRKAGVVVYRDGCFRIEYPGEEEKGYFSITLKFAVSVEIIGNIYENPELVEGQS